MAKTKLADQLTPWTLSATEHCPEEFRILKKIYKTLAKAGNPVTHVDDGEATTKVENLAEFLEVVFSVDLSKTWTQSGAWFYIVLGNGWDALSDYTIDLEDDLRPVTIFIDKNAD